MTTATLIENIKAAQAYELGLASYIYFYSLITMDVTRRQMTNLPAGEKPGFGPANQFTHMRAYPDADFKSVVRPNFDTLYSVAWLDVLKEPVIVTIPDTAGRYYLLPALDMWTDIIASPGWRTSGTGEQKYAFVAPGWSGSLPEGVERIDATTPQLWIIGRIKTDGPDDYNAVHTIQNALTITPLSNWGKPAQTVESKIDATVDMKTPPLEYVNGLSTEKYFAYAAELLKMHKPHATDWPVLAQLKRLGFEAGKSFDLSKVDKDVAEQFSRGAKDALKLMVEKINFIGRNVNGWSMNTDSMGVYGNNYLKRAIVSMVGLGANMPEDAIYPLCLHDKDNEPLVGNKNYVLHFSKDQVPPANAFWSLTMYDEAGFQVANSLNRFAISSWMPLKKNADGSLDLYVQHENPGKDKESNWLPGPATGNLGITMRLYAPAAAALNGDWVPPVVVKG